MKLSEVIAASNIGYSDKISTICKVLPRKLLVNWACDCAESVLHIYENEFPNDPNPRKAIEVARSGNYNESIMFQFHSLSVTGENKKAVNAACSAYETTTVLTTPEQAIPIAASGVASNAANAATRKKDQEKLNLELLSKQVHIYESPLFEELR